MRQNTLRALPLARAVSPAVAKVADDALWLTVPEAARILRIGDSLCWRMVHDGSLPHRKFGRLTRIPRDAVLPSQSDRY